MQLGCMGDCLEVPAEYVVCCLVLQVGFSLYPLAKNEASVRHPITETIMLTIKRLWVREVVLSQGGATSCPG